MLTTDGFKQNLRGESDIRETQIDHIAHSGLFSEKDKRIVPKQRKVDLGQGLPALFTGKVGERVGGRNAEHHIFGIHVDVLEIRVYAPLIVGIAGKVHNLLKNQTLHLLDAGFMDLKRDIWIFLMKDRKAFRNAGN